MGDVKTDQVRGAGQRASARFGPSPLGLLPVVILLLGALPLAASSPWLAPLLLVPFACALWVLRARVVADVDGLQFCNGLGRRRLSWEDIDGFEVRARRPVQLLLSDGDHLALTALSRRDVPRLLSVAQAVGRRADLSG